MVLLREREIRVQIAIRGSCVLSISQLYIYISLLTLQDVYIYQMPVTYPSTAPEIQLPELEGKTSKMYRGGKICLTIHFNPLWSRNVPRFGIAHALALGVRSFSVSLLYIHLGLFLKQLYFFFFFTNKFTQQH